MFLLLYSALAIQTLALVFDVATDLIQLYCKHDPALPAIDYFPEVPIETQEPPIVEPSNMTVAEMRKVVQSLGIKGARSMRRADLLAHISCPMPPTT